MLGAVLQGKLFQKLIRDIQNGLNKDEIYRATGEDVVDDAKEVNPIYIGTIRTALGNINTDGITFWDDRSGVKISQENIVKIMERLSEGLNEPTTPKRLISVQKTQAVSA